MFHVKHFFALQEIVFYKAKKRSARMNTAVYKADVAGAGMWQDTFFVSCRKERTVSPQRKQLMKMDMMASGGQNR